MLGRKNKVAWVWGIFFVVSLILLHMSIRIYAGDEVNVFSHALDEQSIKAVSYTHLTLPTILLV